MSIATLPKASTASYELLTEAEKLLEEGYLIPAIATVRVAIEESAIQTGKAAGLWLDDRRPVQIGRMSRVLMRNGLIDELLHDQTVAIGNKLSYFAHQSNSGRYSTTVLINEVRTICGRHKRLQARLISRD